MLIHIRVSVSFAGDLGQIHSTSLCWAVAQSDLFLMHFVTSRGTLGALHQFAST